MSCSARRPWVALVFAGLVGCGGSATTPSVGDASADGAVVPAPDAAGADASADAAAADASPPIGDEVRYPDRVLRSGDTITLGIDVPDDALAFVVTVAVEAGPWAASLRRLVAPSGEVLFDDEGERSSGLYHPNLRASLLAGTPYAFLYPNAPDLALEPGTHEVEITAGALAEEGVRVTPVAQDLTVSVDVTLRRAAEAPERGAIDLAVWLATPELDAQAARTDTDLADAFARMRDILGRAGLDVARIDFRDLDGPDAGAVRSLDDLARLFGRLHAGTALPIVLVSSIQLGPGRTVLGRTSGIPGPPPRRELSRTGGVAIALDAMAAGPARFGARLAHEVAHYLGLGHTSEQDGSAHDPIADTPECPASRATHFGPDGTPILAAEDCLDRDGANLMFYTPAGSDLDQTVLTDGQSWVLLRSPAVR